MWVPPGFQMDRERAEVSPHPSGVVVWGRWAVFVCSEFSLHPFQTWEVTEVPHDQGDAALSEHFLEHRKEEVM